MLSIISFDLANDFARGKFTSLPMDVIACIGCVLFLKLAVDKWKSLEQMSTEPDIAVRRWKLLFRSISFAVVFVTIAGIVGFEIGTSGSETNSFVADIREMSSIGDRISQSRDSAGNTLPDQIAMYKSIEQDVEKLSSVLTRLRSEAKIFDQKYPAQRETNQKTIQSIEIGLKRASLLREQIAVAKDLEQLDSTAQWDEWNTRMQPLVDNENALGSAK
jgi:hypothetical protein